MDNTNKSANEQMVNAVIVANVSIFCRLFDAVKHSTQLYRGTLDPRLYHSWYSGISSFHTNTETSYQDIKSTSQHLQ